MSSTEISIVILHGWGSGPERWNAFIGSARNKAHEQGLSLDLHTPHLPGFDRNEQKSYSLGDYEKWLTNYLDTHKLKNPLVIGHSNGGRIALYFAARHPKRVSKLVLFGSAGLKDSSIRNVHKISIFRALARRGRVFFNQFNNPLLTNAARRVLYLLVGESDYFHATPAMRTTMVNMLAYNAESDLHRIDCQTLCVWGRDDPATPLWMGKHMSKNIKNSSLHVLDGGHSLYRENPADAATLLIDFIAQ